MVSAASGSCPRITMGAGPGSGAVLGGDGSVPGCGTRGCGMVVGGRSGERLGMGSCCGGSGTSVMSRPQRRSNHIVCLYLDCFLLIVVLFMSCIQWRAWPGFILQELCQARSRMMRRPKRRKCRFLPAWRCNILHAGTVGERSLRVFDHVSS